MICADANGREPLAAGQTVRDELRNITYTILGRSDTEPDLPLYASGASSLVYRAKASDSFSVVLLKEVYPVTQPQITRDNGWLCVSENQKERYNKYLNTVIEDQKHTSYISSKSYYCTAYYTFNQHNTQYAVIPFHGEASQTLADYLESKVLSFQEALELTYNLCENVDRLHALNRLHLDIKPANIIVTDLRYRNEYPIVMLIDFNSMHECDNDGEIILRDLLSSNVITLSTPKYAPPECLDSNRHEEINKSSDTYFIVSVLKEVAYNFTDKEKSNIQSILDNGLNSIRRKRYSTCTSLKIALEELMDDASLTAIQEKYAKIIIPQYFERHYDTISMQLPEDKDDFGVTLEGELTIAGALATLPKGKDLVVIGVGASGKSTLLKKLLVSFKNASGNKEQDSFAVYVPLASVVSTIEDYIKATIFNGFGLDWQEYFGDKSITFLLDGYNETSAEMRVPLYTEINLMKQTFPNCKIILTSRSNPEFLNFEEFRVSALNEEQINQILTDPSLTIEANKNLLPALSNAGLLKMFLQSAKQQFIEDDYEKRLTGRQRILCEWKELTEITTEIELLWNFSFYDFLEKSQTKTIEERAILFICIRFFIPAIAFCMAKENVAYLPHNKINPLWVCDETLIWLRKNIDMPIIERLNAFANGKANEIILETLELETVLNLISDELGTLEEGLHQLNRDFLAAMHLRNLMVIDIPTNEIPLMSLLSDSFRDEIYWEDAKINRKAAEIDFDTAIEWWEKDELALLKHILLYDIEARCEMPYTVIAEQMSSDDFTTRLNVATKFRELLNDYAENIWMDLPPSLVEESRPILQVEAQLDYFRSQYSDNCGEAFLWWLLGISTAENDISFEKRKDLKKREFGFAWQYNGLHFNVCWDRFTSSEFTKIPAILSFLLDGEVLFVDPNARLYASISHIFIATEKTVKEALAKSNKAFNAIMKKNESIETYLTAFGMAQLIYGKLNDDAGTSIDEIEETLKKSKVTPDKIHEPKKRRTRSKTTVVFMGAFVVFMLLFSPAFINGISITLRFVGFDGIATSPDTIERIAIAVSNNPLGWNNWLALIGLPVVFIALACLLALSIWAWKDNDGDKDIKGLGKWGTIITPLLCALCVVGFIFGGIIPRSNIQYDEVHIFGISIPKEDGTAELSETDLHNAKLALFSNLDELRNRELEPISLVSLLRVRFMEKLIFIALLCLALLQLQKMWQINRSRRKYAASLEKQNKAVQETTVQLLFRVVLFAGLLFSLVVWVQPSFASTAANAMARPIIGRPLTFVLQTGSQNLFRLRDDLVTTGFWQHGRTRYEGEFVGNSITGNGTFTIFDRTVSEEGEWIVKDGTFVFGKLFGNGRIMTLDGTIIAEGEFIAGDLIKP